MTKTKLIIDWHEQPVDYPLWIQDLQPGRYDGSGWHKEEGDRYYDQQGFYWTKAPEGETETSFRVYTRLTLKWYETGDLPPIGERVIIDYEVTDIGSRFQGHKGLEALIIAHDDYDANPIAVYRITNQDESRHEYHALVAECFKPLPTEEEKAAAAKEAFEDEFRNDIRECWTGELQSLIDFLYDAGYRKQEDAE